MFVAKELELDHFHLSVRVTQLFQLEVQIRFHEYRLKLVRQVIVVRHTDQIPNCRNRGDVMNDRVHARMAGVGVHLLLLVAASGLKDAFKINHGPDVFVCRRLWRGCRLLLAPRTERFHCWKPFWSVRYKLLVHVQKNKPSHARRGH